MKKCVILCRNNNIIKFLSKIYYNLDMKRVIFKNNFVQTDDKYLNEEKKDFYINLGAYIQKMNDLLKLNEKFDNVIYEQKITHLIKSLLSYRSTIGTEELEGYSPNLEILKKNIIENKLNLDSESKISSSILSMYINYEMPDTFFDNDEIKKIHKSFYGSSKEKYNPGKFRKRGDNNVMILSADKLFIESNYVSK